MAEYIPTKFRKGALERDVETWLDHYQAIWEGYTPDEPLPPRSAFSEQQMAELNQREAVSRNLVVSASNPGLTEPGLWIQDLGSGNFTFWIEDGQ